MLNNELKRNGSGYYDGTPYNAVLCNPEAGDVYESSIFKTYLILKNHGKFSIALALFTSQNLNNNTVHEIVVGDGKKYYSNPAMLQYVFNDIFVKSIGTMESDAFLGIMETVSESLGVSVKVNKEPTEEQAAVIDEQARLIKKLSDENEKLERELSLAKNNDLAIHESVIYKRLYNSLIDRLVERVG